MSINGYVLLEMDVLKGARKHDRRGSVLEKDNNYIYLVLNENKLHAAKRQQSHVLVRVTVF